MKKLQLVVVLAVGVGIGAGGRAIGSALAAGAPAVFNAVRVVKVGKEYMTRTCTLPADGVSTLETCSDYKMGDVEKKCFERFLACPK